MYVCDVCNHLCPSRTDGKCSDCYRAWQQAPITCGCGQTMPRRLAWGLGWAIFSEPANTGECPRCRSESMMDCLDAAAGLADECHFVPNTEANQ